MCFHGRGFRYRREAPDNPAWLPLSLDCPAVALGIAFAPE